MFQAGTTLGRFPGGTPADYWLWDQGWVNASSSSGCGGCSEQPLRPTTPTDLHEYLLASGQQQTVLVVNQLTSDLGTQLQASGASPPFRYFTCPC